MTYLQPQNCIDGEICEIGLVLGQNFRRQCCPRDVNQVLAERCRIRAEKDMESVQLIKKE